MFNAKYPKIATSSLMICSALAATATNFANITPAQAQLFPESGSTRDREYTPPRNRDYTPPRQNRNVVTNTIPRGFVIPIEFDEEKILVTPEETVPVTLYVAADIKDDRRNVLIPYGSEILGEIIPDERESGSFFSADEIVFPDGTTQSIDAESQVVTRRETIKKGANAGDILQGAGHWWRCCCGTVGNLWRYRRVGSSWWSWSWGFGRTVAGGKRSGIGFH